MIPQPVLPSVEDPDQRNERRLALLIARLPSSVRQTVLWLRRPSSRWLRIPVGGILIVAGLLGFLPLLGFWMLPLGIALLAQDTPLLRRMHGRLLDWIAERWPHWLAEQASDISCPAPPPPCDPSTEPPSSARRANKPALE